MTTGMDYGYVSPYLSLLTTSLLIAATFLAGLAFYNLREIRRALTDFLQTDSVYRTEAGLERVRLADALEGQRKKEYVEFKSHTHDKEGKVV